MTYARKFRKIYLHIPKILRTFAPAKVKDERITNEIVLYQPNEQFQLEVRVQDETVWLNRNQMATLFDRDVVRQVEYYSMDVILSVGYRVKSSRTI